MTMKDYINVYKKHKQERQKEQELVNKKVDDLSIQDKKAYLDIISRVREKSQLSIFHPRLIWFLLKAAIGILLFSLLVYHGFGIDIREESLIIFGNILQISLYLAVVIIFITLINASVTETLIFKLKKKLLKIKWQHGKKTY